MKKLFYYIYLIFLCGAMISCGGDSDTDENDNELENQITLIGSWRYDYDGGYIYLYFDEAEYGWIHEYDEYDGGWSKQEFFDYLHRKSSKTITVEWGNGEVSTVPVRSLTETKLVVQDFVDEGIETWKRVSYEEIETGNGNEPGDNNDPGTNPDNNGKDENLNPEGFIPPADYEGVYLGLSVNWSEYNLGANNPFAIGGRYGWGDVSGSYYTTDPNKYPSSNPPSTISGSEYDIVTQKWGNGWRMPTLEEMEELVSICSVTWNNNKTAWSLLGNGNEIILPYAPMRVEKTFYNECGYWTGTLNKENKNAAYGLYVLKSASTLNSISSFARYYGMAIRPVKKVDKGFDHKNLSYIIDGKTYKMILVEGDGITPFYMMQTELPPNKYMQIGNQYIGMLDSSGDGVVIKAEFREFLRQLRNVTGIPFRLPTSAEWKYAANGGNKSNAYTYSGSNTIENVAWYKGNSGGASHDIAQKTPNELGLYDMSGNYGEVCNDEGIHEYKVYNVDGKIFGGCWNDQASDCKTSSYKNGDTSSNKIPGTNKVELNAFDAKYITVRLVYSIPK